MKILAAVMDIVHVRVFGKKGRYSYPLRVEKFLVYDPNVVNIPTRYFGKEGER